MTPKNTHKIKKQVNGEEFNLEVMNEGGFLTVNPKHYDNLNGTGEKYSVEEMVLLLLGVDNEVPIKHTILMKEAFLFEKELSYELNIKFEPLHYTPSKNGAYSEILDKTLKQMKELLTISTSTRKKEIKLNKKGKKHATQLIKTLPKNKINKIKLKRIGWDQYGTQGIQHRIHIDYPLYTILM